MSHADMEMEYLTGINRYMIGYLLTRGHFGIFTMDKIHLTHSLTADHNYDQ